MIRYLAAISVPGPSTIVPAQPPGTGAITTVLTWAAWAVSICCIIGVFAAAGTMAIAHHRGSGGSEHMGRLGFVLIAAVLGTAAGPIINALMG